MSHTEAIDALIDRREGRARNGTVFVREFDAGVLLTMGAQRRTPTKNAGFGANYFLIDVPNVDGPPDFPGVPVVFAVPEDVFQSFRMPIVHIRRESITPAMNRWHPGSKQYRVPGQGATPVTSTDPLTGEVRTGWTAFEEAPQPVPVDIQYAIRVIARNRGGASRSAPRSQANALYHYLARIFQPYGALLVEDTVGDVRSYSVTTEYGVEDVVLEVTDRMIGFTIDVRVEAEFDLNEPFTHAAVTQFPDMTETLL